MARRSRPDTESRQLATTEARDKLPGLVASMREKQKPSKDPRDDAVEIGPHRRGGAVLVPEVDFRAALEQVAALQEQVRELQDEIEDLLLASMLDDLYAGQATGEGKPAEQVARELGFGDLLKDAG